MEDKMVMETERLTLRELKKDDDLSGILQDDEVMYAYEGAFSDEEVQAWLNNQLRRYREEGVGLYAVILKSTGELIGQCGLTMQAWKERRLLEIGYLFKKEFWHKGYATEAAIACREYAFSVLKEREVFSIIRDTNIPSQRVAERNGMTAVDTAIKHYRNVDMPHILFRAAVK